MLKDELDTLIEQNKNIDAGVLVCYEGKALYEHQVNKLFPAAGIISLAVLAYIEKEWKKNPNILNEKIEATDLSRVRGTGVLSRLEQDIWPIHDLVYLSAAVSDNTATNLLIERFDIYEIDDWLHENFSDVCLGRELMRYSPTSQDNEITAKSAAKLISHFVETDNDFTQLVRNGLSNATNSFNLTIYDNNKFPTLKKMGNLPQYHHEVCSFKTKKGPLTVVGLTNYKNAVSEDRLFLQGIGKTIFSKIYTQKDK